MEKLFLFEMKNGKNVKSCWTKCIREKKSEVYAKEIELFICLYNFPPSFALSSASQPFPSRATFHSHIFPVSFFFYFFSKESFVVIWSSNAKSKDVMIDQKKKKKNYTLKLYEIRELFHTILELPTTVRSAPQARQYLTIEKTWIMEGNKIREFKTCPSVISS